MGRDPDSVAAYRAVQLRKNREDPGPSRARARAQYAKVKREAVAHLGGKCAGCGSEEGLQLDHIERLRMAVRRMRSEWNRAARGDTDNLQLLCAPCHRAKTNEERAAS